MELVGTDFAVASSAILATSKHPFISVVSRRLPCRCLLLLLITAWEWSRLLSPYTPQLKQVNSDHEGQRRNDSHWLAATKYAEKGPTRKALLPIFAAPVYAEVPRLLYAAAGNHTPAGKELEHRLPMFFEDTPRVVFLLRDWYTERPWSYALCCVATMLLALISVLLKRARRMLENVLLQKKVSGPDGGPLYTIQKRHVSTPNNAAVNSSTTFSQAKGAESQAPSAGAEAALNGPHAEMGVARWEGSTGEAFALWDYVSETGFSGDKKSHFPVLVGTTADAGTESCQGGNLNDPQATTNRHTHSDKSESIFQADTCNRESNTTYRATRSIQQTKPYGCGAQSVVKGFPAGPNAARAVAAFLNYTIDYLLMLLAMMFNVGILLSLLAGVAIGFLLIGHQLVPPRTRTQFKCSTNTIHSRNTGRTTETRAAWSASSGRKSGLPTPEDNTDSGRADNTRTGMQEGDSGKQAQQSSSVLFAQQSTGESSAVQSGDRHDGIYCCSYTGMARGVLPEKQGGTLHAVNRDDKEACGRPQDRSCPSAARRCCGISGSEELGGGRTRAAATYPCTSAAAEAEAGAADTHACIHGILPRIAVSQPTPRDDVACAGQEAALQVEETSATYKSIDVRSGSSSNRFSDRRENGVSEEGDSKNRLEERMDLPSSLTSPSGEGIEYCSASVRLPSAGRGNQHAHISQRTDLQRPHLLSPRKTEFERRPSDCYDMLDVAENFKTLYPGDFVLAASKTQE